ncbi:GNAT family N-acetyltransferase [Shewanella olleyana]|uniref:GNAT family N-acetyltransferase n=1 Tax=Shewanella olleyana TaxID=135626 RepID=UPI00200E1615|nr:GNAT family N-acetyltransferase [Shewanella olleyana]MCL1065271.1 GNAT family N-acetyltransferase [Shewanella olleyana]
MTQIQLVLAQIEDAALLKALAVKAFQADFEQYGSFPPHIESTPWHQQSIESGHYYIIKHDSQTAGGILLVPKSLTEIEVKYFFIAPAFQNKCIGLDTISLLEKRYPDVLNWSLVTPYKAFRNHHFYQKLGYKKVGEIQPEPNENFWLFEYQKTI